jgi:hypothetical protein
VKVLKAKIRKLQRLLGRKTMEVAILKTPWRLPVKKNCSSETLMLRDDDTQQDRIRAMIAK